MGPRLPEPSVRRKAVGEGHPSALVAASLAPTLPCPCICTFVSPRTLWLLQARRLQGLGAGPPPTRATRAPRPGPLPAWGIPQMAAVGGGRTGRPLGTAVQVH